MSCVVMEMSLVGWQRERVAGSLGEKVGSLERWACTLRGRVADVHGRTLGWRAATLHERDATMCALRERAALHKRAEMGTLHERAELKWVSCVKGLVSCVRGMVRGLQLSLGELVPWVPCVGDVLYMRQMQQVPCMRGLCPA